MNIPMEMTLPRQNAAAGRSPSLPQFQRYPADSEATPSVPKPNLAIRQIGNIIYIYI